MTSTDGYAVGVDRCRGRWVAAAWPVEGTRKLRFELLPRLSDVAEAFPRASVIAVDIPIGLGERQPRLADALAAAFVGGMRSSVFPMPPRSSLEADTHALAVEVARTMGVSAPSIQAFGLRASIFEAEELAAEDWRVIEVHPEVSFCAMAGRPPTHSKKSWNGAMERIRLSARRGAASSRISVRRVSQASMTCSMRALLPGARRGIAQVRRFHSRRLRSRSGHARSPSGTRRDKHMSQAANKLDA